MKIYRETPYVNEQEQTIIGRSELATIECESATAAVVGQEKYFARGVVQIGPGMNLNFKFDIPGESIDQAFANFPACFEKAAKDSVEEFKRDQIARTLMTPAQGQLPRVPAKVIQ